MTKNLQANKIYKVKEDTYHNMLFRANELVVCEQVVRPVNTRNEDGCYASFYNSESSKNGFIWSSELEEVTGFWKLVNLFRR